MLTNEIEKLVEVINQGASAGQTKGVYWVDFQGDRCVRLVGASLRFVDPSDQDAIPEPAGFLAGGGYIALENCEPSEFWRIEPLFPG